MLISYPILLEGSDGQTEEQKLAAALAAELLDEGVYPVSHDGRWHGGIHLNAGSEPIRAIADAEVVCYRFAARLENYPGQGDIDTSFVLLRHSTETGASTPVIFYSLYMHLMHKTALDSADLDQLPPFLRETPASTAIIRPVNQQIYRKDVIGFAGMIYDRSNIFHFEIFTTEEHLSAFWRDSAIETRYGSDDVFGDSHFVVPSNQVFTARHPAAPTSGVHRLDFAGASDLILPTGIAGISNELLHITVQLREGRYRAASYRVVDGIAQQLGEAVEIENYEYELYRQSTLLYPDCPSAGYEWLRFGRVLGSDVTASRQNLKLIRYSETAVGYIDLAQENIQVRSDADFPRWQGWEKVDEGQTHHSEDGIVDVPSLLAILGEADSNKDHRLTPGELAGHLQLSSNALIRNKLRHLVVKHPTEWTDSKLEARYGRLREAGGPLQDEDSWNRFTRHVSALAFWGSTALPDSVWHFHPLQFIAHYKGANWLDKDELKQVYPSATDANLTKYLTALGITCRKYGIQFGLRAAHFYGQAAVESAQLVSMSELYNGNALDYFRNYEKAKNYVGWLGNVQWNDGGTYRGRGFKQLTGRANYSDYWIYRSWLNRDSIGQNWWVDARWWAITLPYSSSQSNKLPIQDAALVAAIVAENRPPMIEDPDIIRSDATNCIDTAGWYWAKNRLHRIAEANDIVLMTNRVRGDDAVSESDFPPAANFSQRKSNTLRLIQLFGDAP